MGYVGDGDLCGAQIEANTRKVLEQLKIHPRDAAPVQALLARAARCYEDALGEKRSQIGTLIRQFETVLERQDPREIEAVSKDFAGLLDQFDGEVFL